VFDIYPAALLETGYSTTFLILFAVLQLCSLVIMLVVVWEFRLVRAKHAAFFSVIAQSHVVAQERVALRLCYFYVISTVLLTLITSFIFLAQPHLL
jgi:hypothetical protein